MGFCIDCAPSIYSQNFGDDSSWFLAIFRVLGSNLSLVSHLNAAASQDHCVSNFQRNEHLLSPGASQLSQLFLDP